MNEAQRLVKYIETHDCYSHPVFSYWVDANPPPKVLGAAFHQIQSFCASTRPGGNFPEALDHLGFDTGSHLVQEIVESEENHGPELATMAAHIINQVSDQAMVDPKASTDEIEGFLKSCSDEILGNLPGYSKNDGLMIQTREAKKVFDRRMKTDKINTYRNLGVTLALEIISHRHLIPGEKQALVDSGIYSTSLDHDDMHYLLEHWGECGAEAHHEENATNALISVINEDTYPYMLQGAQEFLDKLERMWDTVSETLLCQRMERVA